MSDPHGSFIWYELMTTDPDGAKLFYDAVVGWDVESEPSFPDMDYRIIHRSEGGDAGGVMRLTDQMCDGGARPGWVGYIAVGNVDAAVEAVQSDGGRLMMPPFEVPDIGRMAMVAGPEGAPFYVMTPAPGQAAANDAFSVDRPQHVRWNELSSSDSDRSVAFYTRHFGWRQEGSMDMGEMGEYRFLYHGSTMIGAIMPKMPQMPVSLWTYYIGVDDIDRAASAVTSAGGSIHAGPMEVPGGEFAINGMDPQGAAFGLVGPRKA